MKVHASALKHGVSADDALAAAAGAIYVAELDDDSPARRLYLGFDSAGRLLELVILRFDSGHQLIIHAMKARPQYLDLLN